MIILSEIVERVKSSVRVVMPDAIIILYGSFARGESRPESDLDLLILLNKAEITREDEKRVKYPLYDIEFETGLIISPLVLSKSDWETRHKITPFYDTIGEEGIVL